MKKINEGPIVQSNHKGHHLTNADGEVVQSFKNDREGLKNARQSMYKNYKGLNVKKPEPEQPVEEDIHNDSDYREELISKIIPWRPLGSLNYSNVSNRYRKESTTFLEQELDYLRIGLPNRDKNGDWLYSPSATPSQRIDALLTSGIIDNEQHDKLKLKYYIKPAWPAKDDGKMLSPEESDAYEKKAQEYKQTTMEDTGGFEVRLDNGGKVSLGKHTFTYHVNDPSEANTVARSAEKSGMTVLDIDSEEIRINAQAFKHSNLVQSLQDLSINGYITEDKKMSDLENKLKEKLEENITVNTTSTNDDNVEDSVTVTAQGEDALELMTMLKMAGIGAKEAEVEIPAEETPCSATNDIDDMANMIKIIPLDDEMVEEEAELANAPDEKYADTDVLVNKISGGLNRRKKAYAKAEDGDNPMAVTESEEDLTARLLKEYDEFKVTAPDDSDEGNWEIENVGKWAVKIGKSNNVEAKDGELDLPFDTDLASALADEAMAEAEDTDLVEDDAIKEASKPDFLDVDKDGDTKEPMKKAVKDAGEDKKASKPKAHGDALDKEMSENKK